MAVSGRWLIGSVITYVLIHLGLAFIPIEFFKRLSLFRLRGPIGWLSVGLLFLVLSLWGWLSVVVSKAENRANFVKNGGSFVWNGVKNWIRHLPTIVGWALNRIQWRDNRAEYPFHRLRYELSVMMNYLLRLQVYVSKSKFVEQVQRFVVQEIDKKFQYTFSTGQQKSDYIEYASGYDYKQKKDSSWYKEDMPLEFVSHSGNLAAKVPGGAGARRRHVVVCKYIDMLREELHQVTEGVYDLRKNDSVSRAMETLSRNLASVFTQLDKNWNRVKVSSMRYGLSQYKDSLRWAILDMNNRNGWYRHPYKFASTISRPYFVTAIIKKKNGIIMFERETSKTYPSPHVKIEDKKRGKWGQQEVYLWEVDNKGRFIEDINKIKVENKHVTGGTVKNPTYGAFAELGEGQTAEVGYRKIDGEEIYQGDELKEIASLMSATEWKFYKDDFLTGYLHPKSRIWKDYQEAHNRRDWGYRRLESMGTPGRSSGNAAFDREALKDPATIQYKGRINYYDSKPEQITETEPKNNYPCVSLLGLTNYIIDYVSKTLKEEEQIRFFRMYPQYRHDFMTGKGKFGVLGEEEIKKEG